MRNQAHEPRPSSLALVVEPLDYTTVSDVSTLSFNMSGGFLVVSVILLVAFLRAVYRERRQLPPGPIGLPLLGSALQLPARFQEKKLSEWGELYGM